MTPAAREEETAPAPATEQVDAAMAALTEREKEVFFYASPRHDGRVRVHPYRDANKMAKAGLAVRVTSRTNHALRREIVQYFLTPLGLAVWRDLPKYQPPAKPDGAKETSSADMR